MQKKNKGSETLPWQMVRLIINIIAMAISGR